MAHTAASLQAAFKYLFPAEVPAMKELAQSLPPNPVVVNIGAGAGTSGLIFAESRPDLILYTVDIQREDSPLGCLHAEREVLRSAGFDVDSYFTRFVQICMDSKELGVAWGWLRDGAGNPKGNPVDLVFIDGDHSYEGCAGDIQAWLPNIKPGGIIAVHDYKKHLLTYDKETCPHPRPWPGVDRAVDELLLMGGYEMVMYVESLIAFRVPE